MPDTSFAAQRQQTLNALRQAVGEYANSAPPSTPLCAPVNCYGMFGWVYENGTDAQTASAMQGDLNYGLAYLAHMIDQGFETAFAVVQGSQPPKVCLKTWEPGEAEPAWPALNWSLIYQHGKGQTHGL